MALNVNRNVTDQFYRYKMPRLIAKVEGKGNGIKTVISNMVEVGKCLSRPPTYPTKFFGCELGAQTQFDFKNERFIVNGSHDVSKLQDLLDVFIRKYVLCPECDNPETNLIVKRSTIGQHCVACGHQGMIDMRHKLTTFITKNPPEHDPTTIGSSKTERKSRKKDANSNQNGDGDANDGVDALAMKDADDDWSVDTSEDAVLERMQSLTSGAKGITLNDDLSKTSQERLDIFYMFVKSKKEQGKMAGADKEILLEAERLDIKEKGPLILAELLLDGDMMKQLSTYRLHFLRFTNDSHKAQKYLLGAFEQLCKTYEDKLMPKVPSLLKKMYDLDLLEEEVLISWSKKPSKKYVSKEIMKLIQEKAAPFIKWLEEAEEDDSSDDEGVEVAFTRDGRDSKPKAVTISPPAKTSSAPAPADDDIDIDDI
ncbi:eukaryotic translation initiation factor 5-like [Patiria miniata]|uniref:Eukaryotic translation initiation factor 5 n=1 Tax=Patiria miniata TaxID=46514 RepID=A0A914BHW5_PATMI|nr:eukaryotic translation initiation factor 5-like [Patiria miniata]XP_038075869.1 eukaryotic translation initiation factor 5-like [Patiria miniata]